MGLVKNHINPLMFARGKDVKENTFRSDANNVILANDANELIAFRQQGRFLYSVRVELARFT